ncbi:MAG TPA: cytochrome P460 family protein [Burkholderiales bacterium]|nr:cytochrome P460 family protein [Burkholderiales bacterium]
MKSRIALFAGAASAVAGAFVASTVSADRPELITYPADYQKWQLYATVDRYDSKQHRELYTSPEVVKAVREGRPIPDGAKIAMAIFSAKVDDKGIPEKDGKGRFVKGNLTGVTVMEKRSGWGASVPEAWRNADWQYAAFTADGKPNEKANAGIKACFECHKPHERQDYVISLAQLAGKFPTGPVAMKSGQHDVNINGFAFGPNTLKVVAGQPVTWTNGDDSPHQITIVDKQLRTAVLLKGQSASLTFNDAGTIGYICGLHPGMKGSLEVTR